MKRTPISPDMASIPARFHPLLADVSVYDSSCSQAAKVYFIQREGGLFLKSAPAGKLETEAVMTGYFHRKGLGAEVLDYHRDTRDWLLTRAIPGEDCVSPQYLEDPRRLCDLLAAQLRQLHSLDTAGCPVPNCTETYIAAAERNYRTSAHYLSSFPDNWGYDTPEQAWQVIEDNKHLLKQDVLLHGDYCLPNIMLDNWRFSGFIDLDSAGVGDRHIDLFWGIWSLGFNLKTDAYRERFLDAYGREDVEEEMLRVIGAFECFG